MKYICCHQCIRMISPKQSHIYGNNCSNIVVIKNSTLKCLHCIVMMLLTQKLGTKLQRSKSYYAVCVVSGSHWPPFCKRRGQPLQVCAHVCQSRAKRALVCLSPGYQSLSPKTSICSIFLQNPSFIFFLPGLPTYQHVHAHVFACNRRYCSPLSFTSRKKYRGNRCQLLVSTAAVSL